MSRKRTALNVNHPSFAMQVDAAPYAAMKRAVLRVVPRRAPGITIAELERRVLRHLPGALFPGGAKAGWWTKLLQLDLEARGRLARSSTSPLRLRRT